MVEDVGLEPTAKSLRGFCSTDWANLPKNAKKIYKKNFKNQLKKYFS